MKWKPGKQKSWAVTRRLVDVDVDYRGVAEMLGATEREYRLAVPRVINAELRSARAKVAREVSQRLAIRPQRLVRQRLQIDRANARHHAGALRFLVRPIPLSLLDGLQQTNAMGGAFGRETKVKGGGVTAKGQRGYLHAFIAKGTGGHTMVFRRKGPKRKPLEVIRIEIHHDGEAIMNRVMDNAEDSSRVKLEKELKYRIGLRTGGAA